MKSLKPTLSEVLSTLKPTQFAQGMSCFKRMSSMTVKIPSAVVMPFELSNAPATFQHLMVFILVGLNWPHCLVYLDSVIVLRRSFSEHLENLQLVFILLREAELMLKPTKCTLYLKEVQFLGRPVSRKVVRADPANVE